MPIDNLWGEIPEADENESPTSILDAQAEILSEKTGNILTGVVLSGRSEDRICAEFSIRVRSLNNFEITLLRITHDVFMYPVLLTDLLGTTDEVKQCPDADTFKKELSIILQSDRAKRVLSSLLAQTNA